jgi:lysophospholipid acyltransferase (LPLAT)-like uncharacterized protein
MVAHGSAMARDEFAEVAAAPAWSPKQRRRLAVARRLTPALLRGLGASWRWELPEGIPPGAFTRPPARAIYVFWHRCLLPIAWIARDRGFGVLVSQHFDGELIAQAAERLGYRTFRGSSTRGGSEALEAMIRALQEGHPLALTVDGPRGPRFRAKRGAIELARATGAPIYALHASPQRSWTMRSWDKFQVPKPFTLIRGGWAGPLHVAEDIRPDVMESHRAEMEAMLNRLRRRWESELEEEELG